MPYMSKAKLAEEAQRLGLDLTGLGYQEQNRVVSAALSAAATPEPTVTETPQESGGWSPSWTPQTSVEPKAEQPQVVSKLKQSEVQRQSVQHTVQHIKGTIISPEMAQTPIQLIKYDEELGDDIEIEERTFNINEVASLKMKREYTSGTYVIKGNNGKRVVAQSTLPKENAGIRLDPRTPLAVPIVEWQGRVGYLWSHAKLPNIKELLKASGYYEKYRKTFSADNPQNLWYAASQVLVANMDTVHYVFNEIERLAQRDEH